MDKLLFGEIADGNFTWMGILGLDIDPMIITLAYSDKNRTRPVTFLKTPY